MNTIQLIIVTFLVIKVYLQDTNDKIVYNMHNINKLFIDVLSTNPIKAMAMENLNDQYYRFLPNDVPNYILTYYVHVLVANY